jgi:hypothetical protein
MLFGKYVNREAPVPLVAIQDVGESGKQEIMEEF